MLVAFDFDGTLSTADQALLLAEEKGVPSEVASLTDRAANGDVSVEESLRERVQLLEGLPEPEAETAFDRVRLRSGASDLLADLGREHHVAIVTTGFERGVDHALDRAGVDVDTVVANRLPVENDALTGAVEGQLVDGSKDEALDRVAIAAGTAPEDAVAVGDDAPDLPMLQAAGRAIGFSPRPVVRPHCDRIVPSVERLRLHFEETNVL
jgi:phosphoserine phosphatase